MKRLLFTGCVLLIALVGLDPINAEEKETRVLEWDELMPPDWDPFAKLNELLEGQGDEMLDDSPETIAIMEEYLAAGSDAPVVAALDGQRVRLPGYAVPLDYEGIEISEFLLVPYFGACIHVPPPPANQIVFVKSQQTHKLDGLFEPVWVTGTLRTQAVENDIGHAGYTMIATEIIPYE